MHCQKLKKKNVDRTINNRSCQKNLFFCNLLIFAGGGGRVVDQEIIKSGKRIMMETYEFLVNLLCVAKLYKVSHKE